MYKFYFFLFRKSYNSPIFKFWSIIIFLVNAYAPVTAQQCSPISSLSCPQLVKTLPVTINFSGTEGGLADKNGVATGFTMVDRPSVPLVTPTNPNIPGYEPSKLLISGGRLSITTTAGLSFQNPAQSTLTNSQVNALGVGLRATQKFIIQTTLLQPSAGTGKYEQAGLWFGLDEDNYVKFDVVSAGSGTSQLEMIKEVGAASTSADAIRTAALTLSSSTVQLKLVVDPTAHTIQGSYSINAAAFVNVGTLTIPAAFTNGKLLSDGVTNNISFAGIFASNRRSSTPLVFNFEDFKITAFASTGAIALSPAKIYDNDVSGGAAGISRVVTITNTGSGNLSVSAIALNGTNASQFVLGGLPVFPKVVTQGGSFTFTVAFNPSSTGLKTAGISVTSDDVSTPTASIALRGLGTAGLGGTSEPSLQAILDLTEIPVNIGDDNSSTTVINSSTTLQKAPLLGEEISIQKFQKAGAGNVTIEPLAVFGLTNNDPVLGLGWYKSGDAASKSELFTVSNNPLSNGQTVNVNVSGSLSFDPANVSFGFYSRWPFFSNRNIYSEDNLNTFSGNIPHHVRVYAYKNASGVVPNAYVVAFEENTSGFEYQDVIFIVKNVKPATQSNALLFVENLDRFPSNDVLVFSRIQTPWSRDNITYNANHDSVILRIHNKGINPLIINNLILSNTTTWVIEKLNGVAYSPSALPLTIGSGFSADVKLKFIAVNQGTRIAILRETLTIVSNDDVSPAKIVSLNGLWQKLGEGTNEPYAQEMIDVFGFKTLTGFTHTDPDLGSPLKPKGDEIVPSYFVRADNSRPVSVRQMAAYHGCCYYTEAIRWYPKGTTTLTVVSAHVAVDGQSVLPRRSLPNTPTEGTFNPTGAFGFRVGDADYTDATKNPGGKTGCRVWKARDANGNIIPNSYIIANDYLGTTATNYDYNDNMYFVSNLKPETGAAFFSILGSSPSALDFGEKVLQSNTSLQLNLSSLGQNYADGSKDPTITISSVVITGENKSEFTAGMPVATTLNPQQSTTLTVNFKPVSEGLKIADLLIYYNNSKSPYRVPLYGIGKLSTTTVTANFRINSGSASALTLNGKTWSPDNQYAFGNLEPFTNGNVTQMAGTDEDALYLREQSSNGDKKTFRYEIPIANGNYSVRLHFAEIYWGTPPPGSLSGGAGSRVMSVNLENQLRLANFDIFGEVGVATAVVKNFPVTVTDGKLNIDFSATVNRPSVCAVEVYSFSSSAPRPVLGEVAAPNAGFGMPKIFPNPLHNRFTIAFPGTYKGACTVRIADILGRTYEIGKTLLKAGSSEMDIDISKLSLKPGVYFIRIIPESKKTEVFQVVIQ